MEFKRTRIGPISVELPASFNNFRQLSLAFSYQGQGYSLTEYDSRDHCENYNSRHIFISNVDNLLADSADDGSIQYSLSDVYQDRYFKNYAIDILFDDGCATIRDWINYAYPLENREQVFRNMLDIFLPNYQWLKDNSVSPKGFKTSHGVIKMSPDLKVHATYTITEGDHKFNESFYLFRFSSKEDAPIPKTYKTIRDMSPLDRFKIYIQARLEYNFHAFFNYAWTYSRRDVSFLDSYSQDEVTSMWLSINGAPYDLFMDMETAGGASDNCYSDKINITYLIGLPKLRKPPAPPYNILYGYWDKIIQSAECEAY
ncbi:MAG: hypothetical protein LBO66_09350 [Deltaproteobacteria bacterium]|nr:hypothetical protein [Deltaproteobacteria bacterium]